MFKLRPFQSNVSYSVRMPVPNRHVTGQGHYRTPQRR